MKSYLLNQRIKDNPQYALRTSSTGVSAINLGGGATTINAALGYFDTKSLLMSVANKKIQSKLKLISDLYDNLGLDEASMTPASDLDLIYMSIEEFNKTSRKKLGMVLSADPFQLPAVSGKPFFLAKCWPNFKVNYLTEVKRQSDPDFIKALHQVRMGRADLAADWFEHNVGFSDFIDKEFEGSTFYSLNVDVDTFNFMCLKKIEKPAKRYESFLTGKPATSWKEVPPYIELKEGCLIIILVNNLNAGYANGDLAEVKEMHDNSILVRLKRNNRDINIPWNIIKNNPVGSKKSIGELRYMPVRLAYAMSIHKSQSLTLDSVQVKLGGSFLPRLSGGLYTAISRVRTKEGLRLVGTKEDFINSCYVDPVYLDFIK